MTCWKVGRFVQRIVSGSRPKAIRSFVASARQAAGSGPWAAWSSLPAASIAAQSELRPRRVHDRGARIVDLPVEVLVEPARAGRAPGVEEPDHCYVSLSVRPDWDRMVTEDRRDRRPVDDRADVLRRRLVHACDDLR